MKTQMNKNDEKIKIKSVLKNHKGSVIVEASIYFPLVIAAVISVLYMAIGLYQSVILQTSIHMALREAVGERSGTVIRTDEFMDFNLVDQGVGLRKTISISEEKTDTIDTLFRNELTKNVCGRSFVIDEVGMLRILSF